MGGGHDTRRVRRGVTLDAPLTHKRLIPMGLSLFLIGLLVLLISLGLEPREDNVSMDAGELGGEELYPAASTLFGDLKSIEVDHAKIRMLAPGDWLLAPKNGLSGKGRGVMALLPKPRVDSDIDQADMPMIFIYNYDEFPIHNMENGSLYEDGMTALEWAMAVAASETFSDAQMPMETGMGDAMFDAVIAGDPCVCVLSVRSAPILMYYRMPYVWARANTRELPFVKEDLTEIAYSFEAM